MVEHTIGNGEVESSILSRSTSFRPNMITPQELGSAPTGVTPRLDPSEAVGLRRTWAPKPTYWLLNLVLPLSAGGTRDLNDQPNIDLDIWFAELDKFASVPFMDDGRQQPSMPRKGTCRLG